MTPCRHSPETGSTGGGGVGGSAAQGKIRKWNAISNTGHVRPIIDDMPTALLVTDAAWVANDVRAALAVDQWEISELDDPKMAAEIADHTRPDAVIVDMQVRSMGGMAIIRAIRAAFQESPAPRTVLLLDRSADRFLAKRARADAAVLKPIVADELREALGRNTAPAPGEPPERTGRSRKKAPRRA